jgi:hypothetical protein
MLKTVDQDTVVSTVGYEIQLLASPSPKYACVRYKDGYMKVYFEMEGGTSKDGDINWLIYPRINDAITLHGTKISVTVKEKAVILKRISEGLSFLGYGNGVDSEGAIDESDK